MEHFENTNDSRILSDSQKKTLSTGAELAGTARILWNKYPRGTNSIWIKISTSFVSVSNDTQLMVSM